MAANNLHGFYKLFAAFLCGLFCFQSCTERNDLTTVSGKIIHYPKNSNKVYLHLLPDTITFYQTDKIIIDSSTLSEQGEFSFKIHQIKKSTFFDLSVGDVAITRNFFIQTNQNVNLELDMSVVPAKLINIESLDRYNKFLQTYSDTFYRKPEVKQYYYVQSNFLLAPEYAKYIDERHNHQLEFASDILSDMNSDKVFVNYLKSEIDYQWANDKTAFLWKKWIRNEEVKLDTSYYNYATTLNIDNPNALISPAYIRFLHLYIRELHRQVPIPIQRATDGSVMKCDIAKNHLKGTALKIALYHILQDELSNVKSLGVMDNSKVLKAKKLALYMTQITNDSNFIKYIPLK